MSIENFSENFIVFSQISKNCGHFLQDKAHNQKCQFHCELVELNRTYCLTNKSNIRLCKNYPKVTRRSEVRNEVRSMQ